jgi:hypothetical protein
MPARVANVSDAPETTVEAVKKDLGLSLRSHMGTVTRVRMERRKQGLTKNRFLDHDVLVIRQAGEDDDTLIESVVDAVIEEIAEDAKSGSWLGVLHLVNEKATKKSEAELAKIPVRIEDADTVLSRDGEVTSLISVLRVFTSDLCTNVVKLVGAASSREEAIATLVTGVAKHTANESEARYKYEYKRAKLDAKNATHEIDAEAKVYRSTATKFMFSGILERYQPTIDLLTRVWAQNNGVEPGKRKPMPPRPTVDEIETVFPSPSDGSEDPYTDIRGIVLAMLRTRDRAELAALQQELVIQLAKLGPMTTVMGELAEAKLGKQRFAEILAWFRTPWD